MAVDPLSSVEHVTATAPFCPVDCIRLGNSHQRCYSRLVAESNDASARQPTNIPTLTPFSDSWDSSEFELVDPIARDD